MRISDDLHRAIVIAVTQGTYQSVAPNSAISAMMVAEDSADGLHIIILKAVTPFGCGDVRLLGLKLTWVMSGCRANAQGRRCWPQWKR